MDDYQEFLKAKRRSHGREGFEPLWIPDWLFPFQAHLANWNIRKGRSADFAECGLGKGPVQLVVCQNCVQHTNKPSLIVAPLAVSRQFVREGEKFGVPVRITQDGTIRKGINVTNYERLANFNPLDISSVSFDEGSIVKNADGKTRRRVTEFAAQVKYRLLCTATPAPNDFMELGTSAEALGVMSRNQMLAMFFTNDGESTQQWRLKGHAKGRFWKWVSSWARAVRRPSDLGFEDGPFILPPLHIHQHVLPSQGHSTGFFREPAKTLNEQRDERYRTLVPRCHKAAELVPKDKVCLIWCHYNKESELLAKLIPGSVEVRGSDKDSVKERNLIAFSEGGIRVLITKPKIAGFGLNWQHCSDVIYFPSHSHELYYQAIRRCYRFGQKNEVNCHIISSEGERLVVENMLRKERQSEQLYRGIVRMMNKADKGKETNNQVEMRLPTWLS